ncbi:siphovirus Gp157 family protein [Helcococcus kunzii]|uniref:siphovirus Gp157 family protein n=1 Tax=Helcococcus kunzii TaxID=40091 RepID=UPI0038AD154E
MKKISLYELDKKFEDLINNYDEFNEEFFIKFNNLEIDRNTKLDNTVTFTKELDAENQMLKEEIKRLQERVKTNTSKKDRLIKNIDISMKLWGNQKIKTDKFSYTIQKNPVSVKILDNSKVTDEYIRVKKEIDKQSIKDALKKGVELDFAVLEQTESVRIR